MQNFFAKTRVAKFKKENFAVIRLNPSERIYRKHKHSIRKIAKDTKINLRIMTKLGICSLTLLL